MNLEDRIKRRLIMEPVAVFHERLGHIPEAARIAALEAEDTANPLAATAVVRPTLELVLDEAAVISKFPQEEK